jgi:hypothetical protein
VLRRYILQQCDHVVHLILSDMLHGS